MPRSSTTIEDVGVVVIGRNEGERLRVCLESLVGRGYRIAYVDSGSSDGSRELARGLGALVLELDLSLPFTAARARNLGWRTLAAGNPGLRYVQFVDGDCELDGAWIAAARDYLEQHPAIAVASGRLRERHPEASVYNRLCDIEWNAPVGPALACGGNAMMRLSALSECRGFDDSLIAGEEPELCFRLRERGWGIQRLQDEMARHDAAMRTFRQWWRRSRRGGFAYAHGHFLHGSSPEQYCRAEVRGILIWGFALPLASLALASVQPLALLLLLAYPAQVLRLRGRFLREGLIPRADCAAHALNCVACKFPGLVGWIGFHLDRLLARPSRLIEYK